MNIEIPPKLGHCMWFIPAKGDSLHKEPVEPVFAVVCHDNRNGTVNIAGFDHTGIPYRRQGVLRVASDSDPPRDASFCVEA